MEAEYFSDPNSNGFVFIHGVVKLIFFTEFRRKYSKDLKILFMKIWSTFYLYLEGRQKYQFQKKFQKTSYERRVVPMSW